LRPIIFARVLVNAIACGFANRRNRLANLIWPPDYVAVSSSRAWRLDQIRQNPEVLRGAKIVYRGNPVEFIEHWVLTYDPRNAGTGRPVTLPFILFPKQREMVEFIYACLQAPAHGLIEKSRDMGATWLACAFSVWLWIFWPGAAIGWARESKT
jgi:phage terminase large subunit